MKLIVGLGNPGPSYNWTRHNFGALALDFYAKLHDLSWEKPKFGALWLKSGDRIFIKPQEYYNLSGLSTQKFAHFYRLPPSELLVLADDFHLDFATLRYRERGSDGGNRGLRSIAESLSTTDFPRLRLGTNNPSLRAQLGDTDFVLAKFTPEEKAELPTLLRRVADFLDTPPTTPSNDSSPGSSPLPLFPAA